jgi:hypothetical protein
MATNKKARSAKLTKKATAARANRPHQVGVRIDPQQAAPLRVIFKEGVLANNYPDPQTLKYGWRWYLIDNESRLVSPMVGQVPLPRNGVLESAYFIPTAKSMLPALAGSWRDMDPETIRARGFALTFGRVFPPFERDLNISQVFGAMKCAWYQALVICTPTPEKFAGAYAIPIVHGIDLPTLEDVERMWGCSKVAEALTPVAAAYLPGTYHTTVPSAYPPRP